MGAVISALGITVSNVASSGVIISYLVRDFFLLTFLVCFIVAFFRAFRN